MLWALIVPLIGLVIAAQVGDAFAPTLVDRHPLLLMTLNARNRNLILVVNQVDLFWFFVVGTFRLMLSDPLFYLLGYFYGDSAIAWMERRSTTFGRWARQFEDLFRKASYALVVIAPNNPICLLAGAAGMRPVVFFTLNFVGTIGRLILIVWLGETFEAPIDWVLDFIQDYRWYLLAITVSIVAVTVIRELRQGTSEVGQLKQLGDTLEHADTDADAADSED